MRERAASADAYDATILDVLGTDATTDDIFARENLWKDKLGSRATGLNRN